MRRSRGIVLAYHRITDLPRDPFSLAVKPERFEAQIEAVRRHGLIVPLAEVGRHRRPTVAITIDDGYADAAEVAGPILSSAIAPATLFVTSSVLTGDAEFWWDRLDHLLLDAQPESATIVLDGFGVRLHVDVRTIAGRRRAVKALSHRLRMLPSESIDLVLTEVARQVGLQPSSCALHRHVTVQQVAGLAATDLIEIGAHTVTHSMLTALPAERQERELTASRAAVSAAGGRAVTSCAYPFGSRQSYDRSIATLARSCRYERACINEGGTVGRLTNPFLLPRHEVYDWPADEFGARLDRWLAA